MSPDEKYASSKLVGCWETGGPCILCLEPDQESKEKLCELREALAEVLNHETYSSASSFYSWNLVQKLDMGYRPLIPISSFESIVQAALEVTVTVAQRTFRQSLDVESQRHAIDFVSRRRGRRLGSIRFTTNKFRMEQNPVGMQCQNNAHGRRNPTRRRHQRIYDSTARRKG